MEGKTARYMTDGVRSAATGHPFPSKACVIHRVGFLTALHPVLSSSHEDVLRKPSTLLCSTDQLTHSTWKFVTNS